MTTNNGQSLESIISQSARNVTKGWKKQRKKEEKNTSARRSRGSYFYIPSSRVTTKDVVENNLVSVCHIVSGDNTIVATARQLFYRMRPIVEKEADSESGLSYGYFSQRLLPEFIASHRLKWKIAYDDRGHFTIPHTADETIGLGTISVDEYLGEIGHHVHRNGVRAATCEDVADAMAEEIKGVKISTSYPTMGVQMRCSAVLFVEKEGFNPILEAGKLCERYDLALMSTKGQTVTAARKLVDVLCGEDCPLLVVHDFDAHGIDILRNAVTTNRRYRFRSDVNYIDFGLRLSDVEEWGLEAESCKKPHLDALEFGDWLEDGEEDFLAGGVRVELNAFTSPDFIKWLESKLDEHGITKVVPDECNLENAYRRAWIASRVNGQLDDLIDEAAEEVKEQVVPKDLEKQVGRILEEKPEIPWEKAILKILGDESDNSAT